MRLVASILAMIAACAGCRSTDVDLAGSLSLSDAHGRMHQPLGPNGQQATVIVFIAKDCPIANGYAPEINRIVGAYSGAAFFLVYADPKTQPDDVRAHASQFGFECPVLLDPEQALVRRVGASVTPEAAVFDGRGELAYRGRIDDSYTDYGKKRAMPSQRDLRQAIEAVLGGEPVREARTKAIGCPIARVK